MNDDHLISPKTTILLVEDQDLIRATVASVIAQFAEFTLAGESTNGEEAVSFCRNQQPGIVLMDIRMPILDGIDATHKIKAMQQSIRVLMLTASDSDDEIFASFAAGADGYCLKDGSPLQLHCAIVSVVQGAAWIDPLLAKRVLNAANLSSPNKTERALGKPAIAPGVITEPSRKPSDPGRFQLSPREIEVLNAIVDGCSNSEIAAKLIISVDTVKTHIRHIMDKLMVDDRTQAAVKALREGLV